MTRRDLRNAEREWRTPPAPVRLVPRPRKPSRCAVLRARFRNLLHLIAR